MAVTIETRKREMKNVWPKLDKKIVENPKASFLA